MNEIKIDSEKKKGKFSIGSIINTSLFTIAFIVQIIMMFLIHNVLELTFLVYIAYVIWGFSLYFAFISFWIFKKRGGVEKGKSYINTTKLVETGPYAIVRHPQYLGGILFSLSISLWTQHWLSIILSIVIIILTYQWTYIEDKSLVKKFGENYQRYIEKVPRLNPILGIYKYFSRKKEN